MNSEPVSGEKRTKSLGWDQKDGSLNEETSRSEVRVGMRDTDHSAWQAQ